MFLIECINFCIVDMNLDRKLALCAEVSNFQYMRSPDDLETTHLCQNFLGIALIFHVSGHSVAVYFITTIIIVFHLPSKLPT
jgi:hypothetical protein